MAILKDYTYIKTGKLNANASSIDGKYPFFTCSKDILSINTYSYDCECVLVAGNGDLNVKYYNGKFDAYQRTYIIESNDKNKLKVRYLYYFLDYYIDKLRQQSIGGVIKYIKLENLEKAILPLKTITEQEKIIYVLSKIDNLIDRQKIQKELFKKIVLSRFIEMFGDLKNNNMHWLLYSFKDFANIDTNMIHNFDEYLDYPHIGINNIEKNTGDILPYNTIKEDNVISGKYLFTPKHIIYSKIRPNLNKVALPKFNGLCSADAYPILVKESMCNRTFLAYTMRSSVFLDYILAFSKRTNLPKVNKMQVQNFICPLPPIELQNQFADFVKQVDKSKVEIQHSLDKLETLKKSLMQEYFG